MSLDEATVLERLAQIKQALIALGELPDRDRHRHLSEQYAERLKRISAVHQRRKRQRDHDRAHYRATLAGERLTEALEGLTKESQQDGMERRRVKQARAQALRPILAAIAQTDRQIQVLKLEYKTLSKNWQAQMQADYFSSLAKRSESLLIPIVFQDDSLVVVDKPAGLLSVPGRRPHLQDSVVSRLQYYLPEHPFLQAVHRLDQDTSGLLAIACSREAHRELSQQFARRQVHKTYEAILSQPVSETSGTITLPLSADPKALPKQVVDFQQGKPAVTGFKLLSFGDCPRVEFMPHTGRTHQLRLHAAHYDGLRSPILGDELYSDEPPNKQNSYQKIYKPRLHLHATALQLIHPTTREILRLSSPCPF